MKKIIIFNIILILFLGLFLSYQEALAWEPQDLEIEYPQLSGTPTPIKTYAPAPWYFKYIFHFILAIGGITAFGTLIWAGFKYLTSTGRAEEIKDARNQMTASILGLVVLFGSWLILFTINPNLLDFQIRELQPIITGIGSGILICNGEANFVNSAWWLAKEAQTMTPERIKEEGVMLRLETYSKIINQWCYKITSSGEIHRDFDNTTTWAWILPPFDGSVRHGAILYEESNFGGKSQVIYRLTADSPTIYNISELEASSIKAFKLTDTIPEEWYVEIFELPGWEEQDEAGNPKKHIKYPKKHNRLFQGKPIDLSADFPIVEVPFRKDHQFQSIKIEGKIIAIFFRDRLCGREWTPETEVYAIIHNSDSNLNNNPIIGDWCREGLFGRYACAKCMTIIGGGIY